MKTPRMQRSRNLVVLGVTLGVVACGPVSLADAERGCFDRARLAQQPRGEVALGASSDGRTSGSLEVTVTSDYIMGRDPSAVYDACVLQRAGVPPSRPLYSFPEWKG